MGKHQSSFYKKNKSYVLLGDLLEEKLGKKEIEELFLKAEGNLSSLLKEYESAGKTEKRHLNGTILPRIAIYRALREKFSIEDSLFYLEEMVRLSCQKVGEKLHKFTSCPLMKGAFMRIFGSMIVNLFGPKGGFEQTLIRKDGKAIEVDIHSCPYLNVSKKEGCQEIAYLFCLSDDYCYGNLSQIEFKRSGTLAEGSKCCDFRFHLLDK